MAKLFSAVLILSLGYLSLASAAEKHRVLFFSKSSGFEHSVIAWKDGQPSHADKVLMEIGKAQGWEFEFSKDGSKFNADYLKQFDTLMFYTSGDLTQVGKDKQPAISEEGKKALFEYIQNGGGFIGLHCASDTFHSDGKVSKYTNHEHANPFICMLGGEFIGHGKQQVATNRVINPKFPGYENAGVSFTLLEEWYALKNLNPDMHALTVIDPTNMEGEMYKRPAFPTSWARTEGKGRIYYNAMGHREDIWTNKLFTDMLIGAIRWTTGEVAAATPPNLKEVAPGAHINLSPEAEKK